MKASILIASSIGLWLVTSVAYGTELFCSKMTSAEIVRSEHFQQTQKQFPFAVKTHGLNDGQIQLAVPRECRPCNLKVVLRLLMNPMYEKTIVLKSNLVAGTFLASIPNIPPGFDELEVIVESAGQPTKTPSYSLLGNLGSPASTERVSISSLTVGSLKEIAGRNFLIKKVLGEGFNGRAFLVVDQDSGKQYSLKVWNPEPNVALNQVLATPDSVKAEEDVREVTIIEPFGLYFLKFIGDPDVPLVFSIGSNFILKDYVQGTIATDFIKSYVPGNPQHEMMKRKLFEYVFDTVKKGVRVKRFNDGNYIFNGHFWIVFDPSRSAQFQEDAGPKSLNAFNTLRVHFGPLEGYTDEEILRRLKE
ncbi:MAG: hypothetical protein K2X47_16210 [Bdellovibrionales bacterium]|nr:hypothetical protein [Bdellovibrionales bacterium]